MRHKSTFYAIFWVSYDFFPVFWHFNTQCGVVVDDNTTTAAADATLHHVKTNTKPHLSAAVGRRKGGRNSPSSL